MITLYDRDGTRHEFADGDAIVSHFSLDVLSADDLAGIRAASTASYPLHAAIDPYTLEMRDMRVLILEPTARELRAEIRIRQQDV